MVSGWPLRTGRPSYGPTMRDERPTVDTKQEFNASQANLSFWQTGAMGLCAPKAVMYFADNGGGIDLAFGLFSWDNTIYDFNTPSYLTFTIIDPGDYTIEFDNQVLGRPDEDGIQQMEVLDFQFGLIGVNISNNTPNNIVGEFELVDPQTFNILIRRNIGLVEEPFVVAVW